MSRRISQLPERTTLDGTEELPVESEGQNYRIALSDLTSFSSFTTGSVIFAGSTGSLAQNNSKLFWHDSNEQLQVNSTTDSTTKDTGAFVTEGGIGVEKAVTIGTSLLFQKEVNHTIKINDATTGSTQGSILTIQAGKGTATYGGELYLKGGGLATDTGTTGNIYVQSENGRTSGDVAVYTGTGTVQSGFIALYTGNAPLSGPVNIYSGDASAGISGDLLLDCGTHTSTTKSAKIRVKKNIVRQHLNQTIATGGTLTGKQLVDGYIAVTGGTGNVTLPSTTDISTAINNGASVIAGATFDFCVNAVGMTATNTVTLVVGANMTISSAPAITGGDSLTLTQDTQVIGWWRITFITTSTCKIQRIA